jgi:hypothetical protein
MIVSSTNPACVIPSTNGPDKLAAERGLCSFVEHRMSLTLPLQSLPPVFSSVGTGLRRAGFSTGLLDTGAGLEA